MYSMFICSYIHLYHYTYIPYILVGIHGLSFKGTFNIFQLQVVWVEVLRIAESVTNSFLQARYSGLCSSPFSHLIRCFAGSEQLKCSRF